MLALYFPSEAMEQHIELEVVYQETFSSKKQKTQHK